MATLFASLVAMRLLLGLQPCAVTAAEPACTFPDQLHAGRWELRPRPLPEWAMVDSERCGGERHFACRGRPRGTAAAYRWRPSSCDAETLGFDSPDGAGANLLRTLNDTLHGADLLFVGVAR